MRWRPTVAGLMGLVLLFGFGFAALRRPTALWASGLFAAALFSMAIAFLRGIATEGRDRAGWLGFAIFGWSYLLLGFAPGYPPEGSIEPDLPRPLTNRLLVYPLARYMFTEAGAGSPRSNPA